MPEFKLRLSVPPHMHRAHAIKWPDHLSLASYSPVYVCPAPLLGGAERPFGTRTDIQTITERLTVASQPGHETVAWYKLFAHAWNVPYIIIIIASTVWGDIVRLRVFSVQLVRI